MTEETQDLSPFFSMKGVGKDKSCSIGTINNARRRNETIKEVHIAPMLNVSTVEFHAFMRILTKRCILWTEMIVDETIYFQRLRMNNNKEAKNGSDCKDDKIDNTSSGCDWTVPRHILHPVQNEDHPIVCQIGTIHPMWTSIATQCILKFCLLIMKKNTQSSKCWENGMMPLKTILWN